MILGSNNIKWVNATHGVVDQGYRQAIWCDILRLYEMFMGHLKLANRVIRSRRCSSLLDRVYRIIIENDIVTKAATHNLILFIIQRLRKYQD